MKNSTGTQFLFALLATLVGCSSGPTALPEPSGAGGAGGSVGMGGHSGGAGGGTPGSGGAGGSGGAPTPCRGGDTELAGGPISPTAATVATFTFQGPCAESFECSLDATPYAACSSPLTLMDLPSGPHQLAVRSVFAMNEVDPTPAQVGFSVLPPPLPGCDAAGLSPDVAPPTRVRFVTTAGDDANSGQDEALAWRTFAHAATQAQPGDIIFVRAGLYENDSFVLKIDGTATAPIRLRGYKAIPFDEPSFVGLDHSSPLDPQAMPLLKGPDRALGTGIELNFRKHVEIRNVQIAGYQLGVNAHGAANVALDHIFVRDVGNIAADYSGKGITAYSSTQVRVQDSIVVNAAAEGVVVEGTCGVIRGVVVEADDNSTGLNSSTDYYILTNGVRNLVEYSSVRRVGNLEHTGHGIGVKGCATENVIRHNKVRHISGEAYYARHRGAKKNLFHWNQFDGEGVGYGFVARDGASENIVEDSTFTNLHSGITFWDTPEDEDDNLCVQDVKIDTVVKLGGHHNQFRRLKIEGASGGAINYHGYNQRGARSFANVYDDLDVSNCAALFLVAHIDHDPLAIQPNNLLKSSTIDGVATYRTIAGPGGYPPVLDGMNVLLSGDRDNGIALTHVITLDGNTFTNNGFPPPP
ncbi:MAG: hypothetical protein EXR75_08050 [Myxococcales bacterium]|nr:hypothetical protein [Myxococcales bacterium]